MSFSHRGFLSPFTTEIPATLQGDVASCRRSVGRASPPTIRTALPRLRRRRARRACRATNNGGPRAISQVPVGAAHQRMGRLGPIPRTCSENEGVANLHPCIRRYVVRGSHTCMHAGARPWGTHTCILASFSEADSYLRLHACMYVLGAVLLSPLLICDLSSLRPLPRRQAAAPAHPPPPSASVLPIRLRVRHARGVSDQTTACAAAAALRTPLHRLGGGQPGPREARAQRWWRPRGT